MRRCEPWPAAATPPYSYAWEDGSTDAARRLCPDATTRFEVAATDSGLSSPEFHRDPQTARAGVTAEVLDCPPDGGPGADGLCLENPSFEGAPAFNVLGNFDAAPWSVACGPFQGADVWNETQLVGVDPPLVARDGNTYVRLYATEPGRHEVLTQELCAPLVPGRRYELSIDLATRRYAAPEVPAFLEIWGGNAGCEERELLWSSQQLTPDWQAHCVSFTPTQSSTYLTLKPRAPGEGAVFADRIQPGFRCN